MLDARAAPRLDAAGVPRPVARAIERAISPEPAARPRNARVLLDELMGLQRSLDRRASLRRRLRSAGLAAAALAGAALAAWWLQG